MNTLVKIAFVSAVAALAALLFICCLAGCGPTPPHEQDRAIYRDIGAGAARVDTGILSADRHVEAAKPHADEVGKAQLIDAQQDLHDATSAHKDEAAAILRLGERVSSLEKQLVELTAKYDALLATWYVRWGQWIERVVLWILIAWAAFGIVGFVLPLIFPGSMIATLGEELLRLLPFANPFHWIGLLFRPRTVTVIPGGP